MSVDWHTQFCWRRCSKGHIQFVGIVTERTFWSDVKCKKCGHSMLVKANVSDGACVVFEEKEIRGRYLIKQRSGGLVLVTMLLAYVSFVLVRSFVLFISDIMFYFQVVFFLKGR